jgi:hypothetical protein
MEVRHLRVCGDVGQVTPVPFDLRNRASIDEAVNWGRYAVEFSLTNLLD